MVFVRRLDFIFLCKAEETPRIEAIVFALVAKIHIDFTTIVSDGHTEAVFEVP